MQIYEPLFGDLHSAINNLIPRTLRDLRRQNSATPAAAITARWIEPPDVGRQPWRSDLADLFDLRADNTFLIKVAYWLNP